MTDRLEAVKHRYKARRQQLLGESSPPPSPLSHHNNNPSRSSSSFSSSRLQQQPAPRGSTFFQLSSSSPPQKLSSLLLQYWTASGTFFSCRRGTWIRVILALLVVSRFLWNIYSLHKMWVPPSLSPSLDHHRLQRQSYTMTDYSSQFLQQLQIQEPPSRGLHVLLPSKEAAASSSSRRSVSSPIVVYENLPENRFVVERRLRRQARTKPHRYKLDVAATGSSSEGNDSVTSRATTTTGTWVQVGDEEVDLAIPPNKHNWTALCLEASFDSNSRVIISGALTQPPGRALALLLAQKCGVKEFLVVDPLFPNSNLERIQQMDSYKTLKRALPSIKLLIASPEPALPDKAVHAMAQFLPTHMIHLETKVRDYSSVMDGRNSRIYSYRTALKTMRDILQVNALLGETISSTVPKLVIVVTSSSSSPSSRNDNGNDSPSSTTKSAPSTQLQNILARAYHYMYGFPIVYLQLPNIYGPLVATLESYVYKEEGEEESDEEERESKRIPVDMSKFMYVDEAIDGILRAFFDGHHDTGIAWLRGKSTLLNEDKDTKERDDASVFERIQSHRLGETNSWLRGETKDYLGNAAIDAAYLDTYGVPQTFFPCSAKCNSLKCTPSAVDDIRNVTYQSTEDCDYVIYFFDFRKLPYLHEPNVEEESSESYYKVCRVAIVSYKSSVVRKRLLSNEDYENGHEVPRNILLEQNGKQIINQWILVWIYDFANGHDRELTSALLRIDPGNLFNPSVTKVMFTESQAFMKASDSRLVDTFSEMRRDGTGKQYRKVRRPGVGGVYQVLVPAQKSRKVIFYGKEPKSALPDTLEKFVRRSDGEISEKQIEFYKESEESILSTRLRSPQDLGLHVYNTFPYQWLGTSVFVHDLTMKHSQEFRCRWLREFQFWGGSRDSEVLSFAYLFGKQRLQGLYGQRLEHDETSWIPLMDLERDRRLRNSRGWELFIRIVERQ